MLWVAVSWDLYQATRSPVVLGNVGLVQVAPFLFFALFAGHIADRYNRRHIMLGTQAIFLLASLVLATTTRSVALVYGCLFLTATARAFQGPARSAMLPLVVPDDHLGNAIAWNSSTQEVASVSGPAVAGVLLAAKGSWLVYAVQSGCAAVTLLCYLSLRFRPADFIDALPVPARRSIVQGVQFVWNDKLILAAISLDMFAVLFGGAAALLPIYSVEILHAGVHGLGLLRAAPSLGAVAMAIVLAHSPKIRKAGKALLWAVAGYGTATIVFGVSRSLWLSFGMLVVTGAFDNISVVLRHSLVQRETPDRLRGRVLAVNNIFISCSNQLGAVESGLTAAWFGSAVRSVVFGGAATLAVVGAFAGGARKLRRWRQ
ncbi:MAG: transporter [Bryobacterales bacterium]|nr:transporter [Bryobacterales bacterium]